MKLMAASILAFGVSFGAAAQDTSRDSDIATSITKNDMRYVIESAGFTVSDDLNTGIGLVGVDTEGLTFGLQGKACNDEESCLGIVVFFVIEGVGTADYANYVNSKWLAIKATALEDGQLTLSRYMILDQGQTLANLRFNLVTTRDIAAAVRAELSEQDEPGQIQSRAQIDWGNDSGDYAKDGACDDARFHEDGDGFSYQRKHVLRDSTDCRTLSEAGEINIFLDFGNNSGRYANDGTCDDNRFSGEGRSILKTDSHIKRDSADCISAYQAGTINRS